MMYNIGCRVKHIMLDGKHHYRLVISIEDIFNKKTKETEVIVIGALTPEELEKIMKNLEA